MGKNICTNMKLMAIKIKINSSNFPNEDIEVKLFLGALHNGY